MGLDISAYSNLALVKPDAEGLFDESEQEWTKFFEGAASGDEYERRRSAPGRPVYLRENPDFPRHMRGIAPGLYRLTTDSAGIHFRAGSYGGLSYSEWRSELAKRFLHTDPKSVWGHPDKFTGQPFAELVNFSDCEGVIGPVIAAKLADDFANHHAKALKVKADREWFLYVYEYFWASFCLASQNGAVDFH